MDRRILVIDDDMAIHKVLVNHLSDAHTQVRSATDGETGLALARQCHPDLILLDVDMPDITGHEVCRRLKFDPRTEGIPIAFLTAAASVKDKVTGLDHGAVDYIVKPFDPSELTARTRAAFRVKSMVDTAAASTLIDHLTGLGKREAFEQHLHAELARANRSAESLVCIMLEPDDLDALAASQGDDTRDAVLSDVAGVLKDAFRVEDRIFRYSDRQFAVIACNVNAVDTLTLSERLQWAVQHHPALLHRTSDGITISIGLAASRFSFGRSVVAEAIEALAQARNSGGNNVVTAGEVTELRLAI